MITKTQAWGNLADIETHNEEENTPRLIYNRLLAGQRGSPGWASTRPATGSLPENPEPHYSAVTKSIRRSTAPSSGVSRSDFLPTPIGNILRAAERRAVAKYGLDTVALWPRLWLGLPDTTRQELLAARGSLDNTVTAAIWGLLFCVFTPFTALAIPIGLAVTRWPSPSSCPAGRRSSVT